MTRLQRKLCWAGMGRDEVIKYITAHDFRLYVDILTGIYNRRYYEEQLRDMSHVSAAAIAIKNCIRRTDSVVRFGGDEFFVVFGDIPFHMLQEKLFLNPLPVKSIV